MQATDSSKLSLFGGFVGPEKDQCVWFRQNVELEQWTSSVCT